MTTRGSRGRDLPLFSLLIVFVCHPSRDHLFPPCPPSLLCTRCESLHCQLSIEPVSRPRFEGEGTSRWCSPQPPSLLGLPPGLAQFAQLACRRRDRSTPAHLSHLSLRMKRHIADRASGCGGNPLTVTIPFLPRHRRLPVEVRAKACPKPRPRPPPRTAAKTRTRAAEMETDMEDQLRHCLSSSSACLHFCPLASRQP